MTLADRRELVRDGTLSVKEAVAFSGLTKSKIYVVMADGRLPFVQVDGRRVIPKRALIDFLADRMR